MPETSFIHNDEKREALRRLLSSREFASSPRRQTFLRYVVEEEIAGRGHLIKEYSIAVDAYHENTDFDTASRSNIRVQARRVRESLIRYYNEAGDSEPIRISIPVGGYCPSFTLRTDIEDPAPAVAPIGTEPVRETATSALPPNKKHWTQFLGQAAVLGWVAAALIAAFSAGLLLGLGGRLMNTATVCQPTPGLPRINLVQKAFDDSNGRFTARRNSFADSLGANLRIYGTLVVTDDSR